MDNPRLLVLFAKLTSGKVSFDCQTLGWAFDKVDVNARLVWSTL